LNQKDQGIRGYLQVEINKAVEEQSSARRQCRGMECKREMALLTFKGCRASPEKHQ